MEASDCNFHIFNETEIPPGNISFNYIGELNCTSNSQQAKISTLLQNISLGTIYPDSPIIRLKKTYLQEKWQQFHRETDLTFTGAEQTNIKPKVLNIDHDAVKTMAYKAILAQLPPKNYTIEFQNFPEIIRPISNNYQLNFDTSRIKQGYLRLRLFSEKQPQKQYLISFSLKEKRKVLRTKVLIPANTPINPELIEISEVNIDLNQKTLDAQTYTNNMEMISKRVIAKGAILKPEHVAFKEIVKNRQTINGVLNKGGISINLPLTALQNGKQGDRILLEDHLHRKRYYGYIIDSGNVLIEY